MKIISVLLVVVVLFTANIGCSPSESSADKNGFKFYDSRLQEIYVEALRNENIPFTIQEDGGVTYSSRYEEAASKLRAKVLDASFVPSIHYSEEAVEKRFTDRLQAEGIRFGVEIKEGKRWITWTKQDDQRVEKIRNSLD